MIVCHTHPSNSALDKDIILKYAGRFGLFLTGGTDYHGINGKLPHNIGDFMSPKSRIDALI